MSAEALAYTRLSEDTAITSLVGTSIYPDFVPLEKTLPAIAITRTETEYIHTIHVSLPVATQVTLEIWCLGASRASAEALADVVVAVLCGSPGGFQPVGRRPEMETGPPELFAAVLEVSCWE